jgi:hypothetical protein
MNPRKVLILLAVLVPIALVISILASFMYTMNFRESAYVDWPLALTLTAVISLFFMWYNRRELKG